MLEIGLKGLAVVLTALTVAAVFRRGGKSVTAPAALAIGIVLAYTYRQAGAPFSILSTKAAELTQHMGDRFGAVPAAVALGIAVWWHYDRPGPKGSLIQGFLIMTAASASPGLMGTAADLIGSLVQTLAG